MICRRSAKRSSLTGQHKCHIHGMKNVTLNPKEQTRPQVLNSLLAEHMAPDQAGMVGVGAEARATVALALASLCRYYPCRVSGGTL